MFTKLAGVLALTAVLTGFGVPREGVRPRPADPVQRSMNALVREDGFPGVLAAVRGRDGRTRDYTAGVGDLRTGARVPANGQVRIASNTKMFTATVVLQLVGEGKVVLDEPIETYVPGVVRGDGIDGRHITVRQLLQHTSGLPDYDDVFITKYEDYFDIQHTHFEPRQLVDAALTRKALFPPGQDWAYSNTNYVLAGLLVQHVTGRPVGEEITNRVIRPLGLRDTYWPEGQGIRKPHPHGYWPNAELEPVDVTRMDPSMAWAAGQLIGTPRDLNRFLAALVGGELLAPAQLAEMTTLVDAPEFDVTGKARVGLGLATTPLSCGGVAWTHGGDAPGYTSRNGYTTDGRAATVVVTSPPTTPEAARHVHAALDTALCS